MTGANSERGRIALTVEDRSYTLTWLFDSMCQVEDLFSTPERRVTFIELIPFLRRMSFTHIRALLWAALREHHGDVTLKQAGELIPKAGVTVVVEKLVELQQALSPDEEDKPKGRPRKARPVNGTGARVTSSRDGSELTANASGS